MVKFDRKTYWFSIQCPLSSWCSSNCVHEGCGGVDSWLQTDDQLLRILFYRQPSRHASTACLYPSTWPGWNTLIFECGLVFSTTGEFHTNCCKDPLNLDFSLTACFISKCPYHGHEAASKNTMHKGVEEYVGPCWPGWERVGVRR